MHQKLACIAFVALTGFANAQDTCDRILQAHLADTSTSVDQSSLKDAARSSACSMTYKEMREAHGGSIEAQYKLIGGSGSYNESNFNSWKQESCSSQATSQNRDSFRFLAQRAFKKEVIEEWGRCMQNLDGLNCWASPSDGDVFALTVRWKSDEPELPSVLDSAISNGKVVGTTTQALLPSESTILKGSRRLLIQRLDPYEQVVVALNAQRRQAVQYSCEVSVPITLKLPPMPDGTNPRCGPFMAKTTGFTGMVEYLDFGIRACIAAETTGHPGPSNCDSLITSIKNRGGDEWLYYQKVRAAIPGLKQAHRDLAELYAKGIVCPIPQPGHKPVPACQNPPCVR